MQRTKYKSVRDGKNRRLQVSEATNCEETAAWQDSAAKCEEDQVNRPSLEGVLDAKEWVDDGSKL